MKKNSVMLKGILYALAACFIWGLIFVIPEFLEGFSSLEVALGRYAFYGLISLVVLMKLFLEGGGRYSLSIWIKALYFSLACTMVYYISLVLGLRYASPEICALILGLSPITIAFYGNWKQKECSYKSLVFPSILIFLGLLIVNIPKILESSSASNYMIGLFCSCISLAVWTWYVVANAHFLKTHPTIRSNEWSTLIGVCALLWVFVFLPIFFIGFSGDLEIEKYTVLNPALIHYLLGCAVLGLLCSWMGAFLWNRASLYLPVSLAGQLTIFETLFGLLFVYSISQEVPPFIECVGIFFLLSAIGYGINLSSKNATQHSLS